MMERHHCGLFLLLLLGSSGVTAFIAAPLRGSVCLRHRQSLSAKKGFGPSSPPKRKQQPQNQQQPKAASPPSSSSSTDGEKGSSLNAGQKALFEMRRQRAEEKDAELRQVRDMLQADQQLQETPAAIPEPVAQRMGKRMLPFVGLPLFLGMGTFVGFWYMATYQDLEFQPALVAASTVALLVVGLLVRCLNSME